MANQRSIGVSSSRISTGVSLSGTVTHVIGRYAEMFIPNDELDTVIEKLAMWASEEWSQFAYVSQRETKKQLCDYLRQLADRIDAQ